jgi:hypothetical protein
MYNLGRHTNMWGDALINACVVLAAWLEDVSVEFGVLVLLSVTLEVRETAVKSLCDVHTETQKQREVLVIRCLFEHAAP